MPAWASLQSVYNALGDFTDAGPVRRNEPGRSTRCCFELRIGDNTTITLVCTGCGAVKDVDCAVWLARRACTPPTRTASRWTSAEVTYWGLCPACASVAA